MSAARPVYGNAVAVDERPSAIRGLLPLIVLLVALAVATVWYVVLPEFEKPVVAKRSCEVVLLDSGSKACVRDPRTASQKAKPSSRLKG